jgi:D-serine dehydratase
LEKIIAAEARLARCEPLMACLFPELANSAGKVESNLELAPYLQHVLGHAQPDDGKWFIKRDDALPVAGSIKARGGFHKVLALAESLAEKRRLLTPVE